MSGPTTTRNTPARASSSSIPSGRTGPGIRSPTPTTGTASTRTSPTSTSTIRRARGGARRHALLARSRRRRAAARCRAVPDRARGHQQREPARDPRGAASASAPRSTRHYPGRMLLAEANQWPEDTKEYFGNGDECHMAFHFPLMPRMYMALAREDRFPDHRHHAPDAADPRELPVGDLPAQSRRADARDGDGLASATISGRPTRPTGARASISASAAGWRRCSSATAAASS